MNINNPGFLRDDLRVFFLKMLSRLVSETNLKNKEQMMPIDQWNSDFWSDCKAEIEKT
jgi:inositol 1,4,5-triphosphate receptor type 1/inositol 1,4,5-triphosphate receptor type 3